MLLQYETCKNGFYETGYVEIDDKKYNEIIKNDNPGGQNMVPAYERTESSMKFLDDLNNLVKYSNYVCCKKMSKDWRKTGREQALQMVYEIFNCVRRANAYNLFKYYNKRTSLFDDALAWLTTLSGFIDYMRTYMTEVKCEVWNKWVLLIHDLEVRIKGVKKIDAERVKKAV